MLYRVEDFLVEYRETTTIDKVLNKLIGKHKRAELNEDVVFSIETVFRLTDFTVGLVCMQEDWVKLPKDLASKYGNSIMSLIKGNCTPIKLVGEDNRQAVFKERIEE